MAVVLTMLSLSCAIVLHCPSRSAAAQSPSFGASDRVGGMLIGSMIGDAAGGPVEFQPPVRHVPIDRAAPLDSVAIQMLGAGFGLSSYALVNRAAPFGPWRDDAPAGTVTDDTRFKILFMRSLRRSKDTGGSCTVSDAGFARQLLDWHADGAGPFGELPGLWLDEFARSARWVLGERNEDIAAPPERQWGGIPTMAGQMPFLPVAALHPGDPQAAYRAAWSADFLDNGWGRDMTASLVAGLAHALEPGATWQSIERTMRATDPFRFGGVPWVERRVDRWLDTAGSIAGEAAGRPDELYRLLESRLDAETWWEAHVPPVVVFAAAETAAYDPMATLQLILEFGHDTDSYLQLAGAIIGALHGRDVFPEAMRAPVEDRLVADFGESVREWTDLLLACRGSAGD